MKLKRYKQNLRVENNGKVYSYNTLVARINKGETHLTKIPWSVGGRTSSHTTSKHINYVANELNLILI